MRYAHSCLDGKSFCASTHPATIVAQGGTWMPLKQASTTWEEMRLQHVPQSLAAHPAVSIHITSHVISENSTKIHIQYIIRCYSQANFQVALIISKVLTMKKSAFSLHFFDPNPFWFWCNQRLSDLFTLPYPHPHPTPYKVMVSSLWSVILLHGTFALCFSSFGAFAIYICNRIWKYKGIS